MALIWLRIYGFGGRYMAMFLDMAEEKKKKTQEEMQQEFQSGFQRATSQDYEGRDKEKTSASMTLLEKLKRAKDILFEGKDAHKKK